LVATSVDFDPFRTEDLADPYPLYAELRRTSPVAFNERLNGWLVVRYADVKAVLRDTEVFSSRIRAARSADNPQARELAPHHIAQVMSTSDRPRHTALRALAAADFKRTEVERLRPRVERMYDALADRALAKPEIDLIGEIASPLPKQLIVSMLGLAPIELEALQRWTDDAVSPITSFTSAPDAARIERSYHEFLGYARDSVDAHPGGGLLDALIAGRESGVIDDDELISHLLLLLIAGNETSTALLGSVTLTLLAHPEALAELLADASLLPTAMEELLRWDGTVNHYSVRIALEDTTLAGAEIRAGDRVLPCFAAANRDESVFADADRFDLRRSPNPHLAFGSHVHACLGTSLAKLELEVFLERVLPRLRDMRLAVPAEQLSFRPSFRVRSLERLPLVGSW
jgi:cytochrome P450